jgi:thiol-disulfide isomerase/thioredoxin
MSAPTRSSRSGAKKNPVSKYRRRSHTPWIVAAIVVVVAVALGISLSAGNTDSASPRTPAPASLVHTVTTVPPATLNAVGAGSVRTLPQPVGAPALTSADGKPRIVYIGAEYCPYCATERWPMVVALSRFGTFTNLQTTHSSSSDTYPSTPTFSFYGTRYASQYLEFEGVELASNQLAGSSYKTLEHPTAEQQQLLSTYDASPYTTEDGSIPFIDFGGKYLVNGASYDPGVLQGETHAQVAETLGNPESPISQGVIGTANALTAAICSVTGDQPSSVCRQPAIVALQARLSAQRHGASSATSGPVTSPTEPQQQRRRPGT